MTNNISTKWLSPGHGSRVEGSIQLSILQLILYRDSPRLSKYFKAAKKRGPWKEAFRVHALFPNHLATPNADSQLFCQGPKPPSQVPLEDLPSLEKATAHSHALVPWCSGPIEHSAGVFEAHCGSMNSPLSKESAKRTTLPKLWPHFTKAEGKKELATPGLVHGRCLAYGDPDQPNGASLLFHYSQQKV